MRGSPADRHADVPLGAGGMLVADAQNVLRVAAVQPAGVRLEAVPLGGGPCGDIPGVGIGHVSCGVMGAAMVFNGTSHGGHSLRVVIYTRLSRDRDGTATATARQAADCRALAEREGWQVLEVFEDSDFSGFKRGLHRPDYERMLVTLDRGGVDAIVVWKLDRLTRQPGQFEAVVTALERNGARLVSLHESADMTSPAGLAMLRVGMAFAAMESETISLRTTRAKAEQADAGLPNGGGLRPFGLTEDKAGVVAGEADLIREAAARLIAGESLSGICRDWHARGVVSSRGNPWRVTALRRMLANPRLTGARVHRGRVIASRVIPAILDADVHRRVVAILAANTGDGPRIIRPLSGLVRCGRCGAQMAHRRRQNGEPVYRCQSVPGGDACGAMVITAGPLERLVGDELVRFLGVPELGAAMGGEQAARLSVELTDARARQAALTDDHYVHGLVGREDYLRADGHLRGLVARLEGDLLRVTRGDVVAVLGPGESIADAWAGRPDAWRNRLARAALVAVHVDAAPRRGSNRFDPGRVRLEWLAQ